MTTATASVVERKFFLVPVDDGFDALPTVILVLDLLPLLFHLFVNSEVQLFAKF